MTATPIAFAAIVVGGAAIVAVLAGAVAVGAGRRAMVRRTVVARVREAGDARGLGRDAALRVARCLVVLLHEPRARAALSLTILPCALIAGALAVVASVAVVAVPPVWERHHRRRQEADADAALPDVLERVARALRSGTTLVRAVSQATPVAPRMLAEEWALLASRASDAGLSVAVERWAIARPSPSVRLTAAALQLAADVGGPQARAVDGVASTLRHRLAVSGERRAMSAQATASAVVIAAAPVAFAAITAAADPRFVSFLLGTPMGSVFLFTGIGLEAVGAWWMSRITRIEP